MFGHIPKPLSTVLLMTLCVVANRLVFWYGVWVPALRPRRASDKHDVGGREAVRCGRGDEGFVHAYGCRLNSVGCPRNDAADRGEREEHHGEADTLSCVQHQIGRQRS